MPPSPKQNSWIEQVLKVRLDHYDPAALTRRYQIICKRVAEELKQDANLTDPRHDYFHRLRFNVQEKRTPVVDALFTQLRQAADVSAQSDLVRQVNDQLNGMEDQFLTMFHDRAEQQSRGPTTMETAVLTADYTMDQLKHYAHEAQEYWERFESAHATVFAVIGALHTLAEKVQDLEDLVKVLQKFPPLQAAFMNFVEVQLPLAQQAAAASAAVVGPIGPIAGTLAIIIRFYTFFVRFLETVLELIGVLDKLVAGKNEIGKTFAALGKIVQTLNAVAADLDSIRKGIGPLRLVSQVVRQVLKLA